MRGWCAGNGSTTRGKRGGKKRHLHRREGEKKERPLADWKRKRDDPSLIGVLHSLPGREESPDISSGDGVAPSAVGKGKRPSLSPADKAKGVDGDI